MAKNFVEGVLIFKDGHTEDVLRVVKFARDAMNLYTETDRYICRDGKFYKRIVNNEKDFPSVKYDYELVEIDRFVVY